MVHTRSQLEHLSKDELIDELKSSIYEVSPLNWQTQRPDLTILLEDLRICPLN